MMGNAQVLRVSCYFYHRSRDYSIYLSDNVIWREGKKDYVNPDLN